MWCLAPLMFGVFAWVGYRVWADNGDTPHALLFLGIGVAFAAMMLGFDYLTGKNPELSWKISSPLLVILAVAGTARTMRQSNPAQYAPRLVFELASNAMLLLMGLFVGVAAYLKPADDMFPAGRLAQIAMGGWLLFWSLGSIYQWIAERIKRRG